MQKEANLQVISQTIDQNRGTQGGQFPSHTNISLSVSGQYSTGMGTGHSENTLVNLLMYESQNTNKLLPINPINNQYQIEEYSNEQMPTYYHDNTQDNQYEPSEESSEDLLFNLIIKLVGALSYRIRINQRNAFESIYVCRGNQHHLQIDLSSSQSQQSSSIHSVVGVTKILPQLNIQRNPKIRTNLHETKIQKNRESKEVHLKPLMRFLPDIFKEDEGDYGQNFDSLIFQRKSQTIIPQRSISNFTRPLSNLTPITNTFRATSRPSFNDYQYERPNQPQQTRKINITYKNSLQPRSQSDFGRMERHHSPSVRMEPTITVVRSQYFHQNAPRNVVVRQSPVKRVESAPTSPLVNKFRSKEGRVQMVKPQKPIIARQMPKKHQNYSQYYEFTRPAGRQPTNNSKSSSSVRSTKGISIVSAKKSNKN